jgi:hypothetical protein
MSVFQVYQQDGAKRMRPIRSRAEYMALRDSAQQQALMTAVRSGAECKKRELVQMNYVYPGGEPVFDTVPMSFHDASGRVTDYWQTFYSRRGMQVPEGMAGTNPGELSRRREVTILGRYPVIL